MEIKLTADGRLTVNGKSVDEAKLAEQLADVRKRKTIKGGLGPGKDYFSPPPVSIQVDEQLPYEQLRSLIGTLAKEGFLHVTFQGNTADKVK
jgi:biopolymer transport protein ExbD